MDAPTIDSKRVFKKTLPFIAIFILSISAAFFNYVQQTAERTQAAGSIAANIPSPIPTPEPTFPPAYTVGFTNGVADQHQIGLAEILNDLSSLFTPFLDSSSSSSTPTPPSGPTPEPGTTSTPLSGTPSPTGARTTTTAPTSIPPASKTAPTSASLVQWAAQISNALQVGYWGSYNRQQDTISNGNYAAAKRSGSSTADLYWCTNLIIDAYNLSGLGGLSLSQQSVLALRRFFASASQYTYVDFRSSNKREQLARVKLGYAMIMQSVFDVHNGYEHVALVKNIQFDNNCNGSIETYESNSSRKTHSYPIVGCDVRNLPLRDGIQYKLVAFAGP